MGKEMSDLTPKQRKWLKVYIETGNGTEAAMQAYDCKDRASAAQIGTQNLRKLQGATRALAEAKGLTDDLIFQRLKEGLSAEKTEFAKGRDGIIDSVDCIDYPTRLQYIRTAAKLFGLEPANQLELSGPDGGAITLISSLADEDKSSDTHE